MHASGISVQILHWGLPCCFRSKHVAGVSNHQSVFFFATCTAMQASIKDEVSSFNPSPEDTDYPAHLVAAQQRAAKAEEEAAAAGEGSSAEGNGDQV